MILSTFLLLHLIGVNLEEIYLWSDKKDLNLNSLNNLMKQELNLVSYITKISQFFESIHVTVIPTCAELHNSCYNKFLHNPLYSIYLNSPFHFYQQTNNLNELYQTLKEIDSNFTLGRKQIGESQSPKVIFNPSSYAQTSSFTNLGQNLQEPILNILVYSSPSPTIAGQRSDSLSVKIKTSGLIDDGVFLEFSDCIYFYAYSSSIKYKGSEIELPVSFASVETSTSSCEDTNSQLSLKYANVGGYAHVEIQFSFQLVAKTWQCESIKVIFEKTGAVNEEIALQCSSLKAYKGMSYMCDDIKFRDKSGLPSSILNFKWIQVQPFVDASNVKRFGPADSCIYFVTLPILMGIFVVVIILIIVILSLNTLSNIQGISRFENPKEHINFGNTIK